MDIYSSEGIFRVHIDIYTQSCSELECSWESSKFSVLCRGPNQQQRPFDDSVQSHYCISSKMCAFLDKAAAIHEGLNISWLIGWSVKSEQLENTSSIISRQSCSGGPESTSNKVTGFWVLTTSSQIHGFSHNVLCLIFDLSGVCQSIISFIFYESQNRVGNLDCEFLFQISSSASATKMAVADRVCRQSGQSQETAVSCFDK
jgi:hypothetical protein